MYVCMCGPVCVCVCMCTCRYVQVPELAYKAATHPIARSFDDIVPAKRVASRNSSQDLSDSSSESSVSVRCFSLRHEQKKERKKKIPVHTSQQQHKECG